MVGHKALVCRKRDRANEKQQPTRKPAQQSSRTVASALDGRNDEDNETEPETPSILQHIGGGKNKLIPPIRLRALLNGHDVSFDVDTGSPITVITEHVWREVLTSPHLRKADLAVHSYSGHALKVLGSFEGVVEDKGRRETLTIYVASGTESCLFGRDAIK